MKGASLWKLMNKNHENLASLPERKISIGVASLTTYELLMVVLTILILLKKN